MVADCALELKSHNVSFISLWPGPVNTEHLMEVKGTEAPVGETSKLGINSYTFQAFGHGESMEFSGKCIVAMATGVHNNGEKIYKKFIQEMQSVYSTHSAISDGVLWIAKRILNQIL